MMRNDAWLLCYAIPVRPARFAPVWTSNHNARHNLSSNPDRLARVRGAASLNRGKQPRRGKILRPTLYPDADSIALATQPPRSGSRSRQRSCESFPEPRGRSIAHAAGLQTQNERLAELLL